MATGRKRTLDAATFPSPDSAGAGEDAADVRGAGKESGRQRRARQRADSPRARRERYDRGLADERRRTRRDAAGRDGDPLARLKLETQRAQEQFVRHLRTSGLTSPGVSPPDQGRRLSELHRAYVQSMVVQCLEPLRSGINARNVLTTVGMGTAIWLLSPNVRTAAGEYAGQMAAAIDGQAGREARIAARGEKSRRKEARHLDRTGEGREGMRGPSGWVHRRRLERLERMERGGRDPFTEHSAALAHVGIAQNAYDEMRRPGADRDLVKRNYESALSALYGCVDQDGLDREEVARDMRGIVGRLIERDPEHAAVFAELGHGRFVKSEPRTVVDEDTRQTRKVWTGDYVDAHNGDLITGGTFSVREPMGTDEHRAEVARTMYADLAGSKGSDGFRAVTEQYVIGSKTLDDPEAVERTEDASTRARMERARSMFASMRGDGISERDQKLVYVGGFVESLQAMERTHPQKVAQWRQGLGPEGMQRMHDLIRENSGFDERSDREPRGGREPEPGPERGRADSSEADPGQGSKAARKRDRSPADTSVGRPGQGSVARRVRVLADKGAGGVPAARRPANRITPSADPEQNTGHELGG